VIDTLGADMEGTAEPDVAEHPRLVGRWVTLRPLRTSDMPFFFELMHDERIGFRWRFRGQTPSFEAFTASMWQGVTAQFVIEDKKGAPLGLVVLYNVDHRHGIAYLATMVRPDLVGRGWPMEGLQLFCDYVFRVWALRKIYAEALEFNYAQFASWSERVFTVEGLLRDHEFYDGRYWDLYIFSTTREAWEGYRRRPLAETQRSDAR